MKTINFFGVVLMTLLMCVGFISCSSDKDDNGIVDDFSIVGSWEMDDNGKVYTWIFYPDNTYESDISTWGIDGKYVYGNGSLTYTDRSYTVKDGKKVYTGDSSSFTVKVEVVSSNKMIWTNTADSSKKATLTRK